MYTCESLLKSIQKILTYNLALGPPVFVGGFKKALIDKERLLENVAETRRLLEKPIKIKYITAAIGAVGGSFDRGKYDEMVDDAWNTRSDGQSLNLIERMVAWDKFVGRYFGDGGSKKYKYNDSNLKALSLSRILRQILDDKVDANLISGIVAQLREAYGRDVLNKFYEICVEMQKENAVYRDKWWIKHLSANETRKIRESFFS
jgi:hypothetical protein